MRLFVSLLPIFSFSIWAHAQSAQPAMTLNDLAVGSVEMVSCPAVSEDFSNLITRLDSLKASIKKGANCKDVDTTISSKFDGIAKTRDRFLELVKKSQTDTLTEAEIKEIGNYADQVTTKVSSIIDLMTNANSCFESDADKKALTSLSGFVSEASTLLSQVAGPWGAPVAIGGQILSGFLTGLDKILKSRAGYDFSDNAQWVAYLQNLCTYQAVRQSAEALLHPQDRISKLRSISNKLDQNMLVIQSVCPECGDIQAMPMGQMSKDAKIQFVDTKYIARVGSLASRVRNAQSWVKAEIARVSGESNAYWNNVTGKNALSNAQRDLEKFLLEKEAPRFLEYQYSRSSLALQDLRTFLYYDGSDVLKQAYKAKLIDQMPSADPGLPTWGGLLVAGEQVNVFKALTSTDWRAKFKSAGKNPDELGFRLINARKTALAKFDTTSWSYGVSYVLCDYFQQADLYSSTLQSSCTSTRTKNLGKSVADLAVYAPDWQASQTGLRAADWDSVLSMWADQVYTVMSTSQSQMR